MDSLSERRVRLAELANEIFGILRAAEDEGFDLVVKHGWALDLRDKETGKLEALTKVTEVSSRYGES